MKLTLIPWTDSSRPERADLERRLAADGFDAMAWHDPPRHMYAPHRHDHDECLWCLDGAITFHIDGRDYRLDPGDRLLLPRGTLHAATAGPSGAAYLIGERA